MIAATASTTPRLGPPPASSLQQWPQAVEVRLASRSGLKEPSQVPGSRNTAGPALMPRLSRGSAEGTGSPMALDKATIRYLPDGPPLRIQTRKARVGPRPTRAPRPRRAGSVATRARPGLTDTRDRTAWRVGDVPGPA